MSDMGGPNWKKVEEGSSDIFQQDSGDSFQNESIARDVSAIEKSKDADLLSDDTLSNVDERASDSAHFESSRLMLILVVLISLLAVILIACFFLPREKDESESEEMETNKVDGDIVEENVEADVVDSNDGDGVAISADEIDTGDSLAGDFEKIETSGVEVYSSNIHTYNVIVKDCTWDEAYLACYQLGGHLLTLETDEEYDLLVSQMNSYQDYIFYIGGRCVDGQYYWIAPVGVNNDAACSSRRQWMKGEPSYSDGEITEDRMSMFYRSSESSWVWNDVPSDVLSVAPNYSGKIGFICEYE